MWVDYKPVDVEIVSRNFTFSLDIRFVGYVHPDSTFNLTLITFD